MKFAIRPLAREDILRQYEYYLLEVESELVAARFLTAVQSAIAQVCRQPGTGSPKALRNLKFGGIAIVACERFPEHAGVLPSLERCTACGACAAWQERY